MKVFEEYEIDELDYATIGKHVRSARDRMHLTQQDVRDLTGITTSHLSHIEKGTTKVALPTLIKLANVLSVSMDELLYDNLDHVEHIHNKKIATELEDCDSAELDALYKIIRSTKEVIRKSRKVINIEF